MRRDGDRDGNYDHGAAVAIMDAWWTPMINAIYNPALGRPVGGVSRQGFHNAPGSGGSAFQGGFYGQVWTDLSMVLGDPVAGPTSQVYCGSDAIGSDGDLTSCAEALWDSLTVAGDALASSQGNDPAAWQADAAGERITFIGVAGNDPTEPTGSMHWVNRPTTQLLAMFGRNAAPTEEPAPTPAPLPATGGGLALAGLIGLTAAALPRRRRLS